MFLHRYQVTDGKGKHLASYELRNLYAHVLGSAEDCDIRIEDGCVSSCHAELTTGWIWDSLRDLGSANGTVFRGERLGKASRSVRPGDFFYLGPMTRGILILFSRDRDAADVIQRTRLHASDSAPTVQITVQGPVQAGGDILIGNVGLSAPAREPVPPREPREPRVRLSWPEVKGLNQGNCRYQIIGKLGEGGMARVCVCRDMRDGRLVAAKIAENGAEIEKESAALSSLRHEHVVAHLGLARMTDANRTDITCGAPMLILELLSGRTWKEIADGDFPPVGDPESRATYLRGAMRGAAQIAAALLHCHNQDIVHNDIRDENLMTAGDRSVLLDFGLARHAARSSSKNDVAGTIGFLAPEKFTKRKILDAIADEKLRERTRRKINLAIDGYGFGASLFCLLTRRTPLKEGDVDFQEAGAILPTCPRPSR